MNVTADGTVVKIIFYINLTRNKKITKKFKYILISFFRNVCEKVLNVFLTHFSLCLPLGYKQLRTHKSQIILLRMTNFQFNFNVLLWELFKGHYYITFENFLRILKIYLVIFILPTPRTYSNLNSPTKTLPGSLFPQKIHPLKVPNKIIVP